MKRLLFLLMLSMGILCGQPTVLQVTHNFTAAGTACTDVTNCVIQNNFTTSGGPAGWIGFRMTYYIQPGSGTVSALSVELDGAATSTGSYTALTPAVGGGSGSGSTLNPVTTTPRGQNNLCCDYYPFLQIKINTLTVSTGTPILVVKVIGYAGTSAAAGSGGGGGGGGITALTQDVLASGSGSVPATVVGINTVPLCSGFSPADGQFLKYTTASSPNPCYTAATASGGGGGGSGLTVYSGLAGVALSNATIFFPIGGGSLASSTESAVNTFQGVGGTMLGFGVDISTALGTTVVTPNSVVLTWRKNGADQATTCTIANPATTCSDTTHGFAFVAGDALDIKAVFTGTISATPVWVMNAGVSTGTASGGVGGKSNFSLSGGTVSKLSTTGVISGITRTNTGRFTVSLSPSQTNFSVALVATEAGSGASIFITGSPDFSAATSSFDCVILNGNGTAFVDSSQVTVAVMN